MDKEIVNEEVISNSRVLSGCVYVCAIRLSGIAIIEC